MDSPVNEIVEFDQEAESKGRLRRPRKEEYKKHVKDIYSRTLITKSVMLEMREIGVNIKDVLETKLKGAYEGKCILEGFVKPNTSKIVTYSSGVIKGSNILFEVVFECMVCFPVEGQLLNCIAKNVTKAGIRGESAGESPSPFVVFVARDHQIDNDMFSEIKENAHFVAKIIGQRFELNDKYVSVIGEVVNKNKYK